MENILKFKMGHIYPRIPVSITYLSNLCLGSQKSLGYAVNNNDEVLKLVSHLPVMCYAFLIIEEELIGSHVFLSCWMALIYTIFFLLGLCVAVH